MAAHRMIVMPSNCTGWYWDTMAIMGASLGHLFGLDGFRTPRPWLPYALDNGAYPAWKKGLPWPESQWVDLVEKAKRHTQAPTWALVPDVVADRDSTLRNWDKYAGSIPWPRALALQNGMTDVDVLNLDPHPDILCVGGTDDWKWGTVADWAKDFPRVHLLRCGKPQKLAWLEGLGIESTDGTGWNRGNDRQAEGLYRFLIRDIPKKPAWELWRWLCASERIKGSDQFLFGEAA